MTPRYGTGKADANQAEIVAHVRTYPGAYVEPVSVFPGVLDLIVYGRGVLTWWEVKVPGEEARLTKKERKILFACVGVSFVVSSIEEADQIMRNVHGYA